MVSSQTAREQDAERGKNYYNSGVTREMSNTGHMGFTAKGIMREWAQTAAMRRGLVNVITVGHVLKSEGRQDIFLDLGGLIPVVKSYSVVALVGRGCFSLFVFPSVCLRPRGFQTDLAEIRSD